MAWSVLLGLSATLFLALVTDARNPARREPFNSNTPPNKEEANCPNYNYCAGENFPERVTVRNYNIKCHQEENIKNVCCLPSSQHLVCYDITVEGDLLNYSNTTQMESTDYSGLCNAMLESIGRTPSRYQSAALKSAGGSMIYLYDRWVTGMEVKEGALHIRHLACGVTE